MTNERGFTLAELLVVIAVLGLIMAGVVSLQQQGQAAYIMGANRVDAQQNARVAMSLMTRELREACTISSATATSIVFTIVDPTLAYTPTGTNYDCGTAPSASLWTVTFTLSGTTLNCTNCTTNSGTAAALIGGVAGLTFQGYDSQNTANMTPPTTACAAGVICSVDITLITTGEQSVATYSPGYVHTTFESRVRLRNF